MRRRSGQIPIHDCDESHIARPKQMAAGSRASQSGGSFGSVGVEKWRIEQRLTPISYVFIFIFQLRRRRMGRAVSPPGKPAECPENPVRTDRDDRIARLSKSRPSKLETVLCLRRHCFSGSGLPNPAADPDVSSGQDTLAAAESH